jgi:hypothetical protein
MRSPFNTRSNVMTGITCQHYEAYVTIILGFVACGLGHMTASQRDRTFQTCFRASVAVGKSKNIVFLVFGSFALFFHIT